MNTGNVKGHDDRVDRYRAKPKGGHDLDDDASTMVQEQIARIKHFFEGRNARDASVLDWGCGTGFNCEYVIRKYGAKRALGIDISKPTVEYARKQYPDCEFQVGDVCDSDLDVGVRQWDVIICCEVFEHVSDVNALLDGIARHMAPGGVAFITTPNKPVFSLGFEPSPVNRTHIREYTLDEFEKILRAKFPSVVMSGQRFRSNVMELRREAVLRRSIRDFRILGRLYWNRMIRRGWKLLRFEPLLRWREGAEVYRHYDYEFVTPPDDKSIWLCATVRK